MKTINLHPFLGINNRLPAASLKAESGRWLKNAENVDIRNDGSIVRRRGVQLVQAMSGAHSLFENLLVRGSALYTFAITSGAYSETLVSVLSNDSPMSYWRIGSMVFMSNGTDAFKWNGTTLLPWAMPAPVFGSVETLAGGTLLPGKYLLALAYSSAGGANNAIEGVLSTPIQITVTSDGGFKIPKPTNIPPEADNIRVYLSGLEGGAMYRATSMWSGSSATHINVTGSFGMRDAHWRHESALPAGTQVVEHNGRLCSVVGDTLYVGLPYRHGYYEPASGFVRFHAAIKLVAPVQGGLYVVADKTYFLSGADIQQAEAMREVYPYSGVAGTVFKHPTKTAVGWMGNRGIVLGDPMGQVAELSAEAVYHASVPTSGASRVVSDAERDAVVCAGHCTNLANGSVTKYTGYDFNSYAGSYALKSDGLWQLDADKPVAATVDFGSEDFGSDYEKAMPSCYVGMAGDAPLMLTVSQPDGSEYDYEARSYSETLDIHRIDTGRGLRSSWFGLKLSNIDGADFELQSVAFTPAQQTRRI